MLQACDGLDRDHPAVPHDRDAVRDDLHLAEQVRGQQDGLAATAHLAQDVAHERPAHGIQGARRLVEQHEGRATDQGLGQTEALLQNHPDLKGIISPTTVGIAAAARYLSDSSSKGKVALTGLGTPNQMREYVENGTVESFALWNPSDLGALATYAAAALANGDISGEEGDSFEAGDLGEFEVGADGVVLLGEPFTFDADNIGDFDF